MDWNQITSQKDVNRLNDMYDNFHDSYLKEICYSTGSYVSEELEMCENNKPISRFLFQRNYGNPNVIEIEFGEVIGLNIIPEDKTQFTDIIVAHLYLKDGVYFWSSKDYEIHERDKDSNIWISAKSVRWRVRNELLGDGMVYIK